ncbi:MULTISPECIES: bifunctional RNase H/acid phosphatase [unclassified Streptomyces]|uniref:bifunctional RNase H/acid phosphatase n=1 Tax=unclassified Streptomyces TaxID=2593676 RepID=UPI0006AE595C|nr:MULTISPECIES: bifunctional RNase H/acid phosphatase [unclassified Streptomyces]KOX32436.1 ribonuclease [Streptomyces sp. NRRL F-6491]KOX48429.1 ribonuclease [Streptomyces sp. NRRL F-6492]
MTSARELVVEADGGSRGNPGPAGYGAVVLDAVTGETLAEAAEYIGVATNNVAEYKGLVAGLKTARELFPDAIVHVRMDSKLVVEQMSGRWKIKHPDMKPLAAEAGRVFPAGRVRYEWIPRERNKHADRLANEAMDAGRLGRQWEPSGSTAALDASAARNAAAPPPSGPPGDARAGAARARAALSGSPAAGTSGPATTGAATSTSAGTSAGAGAWPTTDDGLFGADEVTVTSSTPVASGDFEAEAGVLAPTGHAADTTVVAGTGTDTGTGTGTGTGIGTGTGTGTGATRADASASAPASVQPRGTSQQGWSGPDMGVPATFVLLRHGETALTPEKRFSGSGGTDPELSAAGLRQAEAVAAALAARGTVQEIVSSPLTRCRQTAAAVAARLGLDVRIEQGLRETDFGAWEGLTFGEVRERYPEDLDAWLASPKAAPTGGGESFATVARRVAAARDRLTAAHAGRTVLLVTHVTPIKTLVRLALGAPPESLFRMELSAASLSAVAYYADGNASVRLLNDTSHLR